MCIVIKDPAISRLDDSQPVLERLETVPFVWPKEYSIPRVREIEPFVIRGSMDKEAFRLVQNSIGWPVSDEQWQTLSNEMVAESMMLITLAGEPVATACGLKRGDSWVELAWVAVSPDFRARGLGKVVCESVVMQLLDSGFSKIYGSTQDERLSAIKIYLDIGFYPLYRKDKIFRWKTICQKLGRAFTPDLWDWPKDA